MQVVCQMKRMCAAVQHKLISEPVCSRRKDFITLNLIFFFFNHLISILGTRMAKPLY